MRLSLSTAMSIALVEVFSLLTIPSFADTKIDTPIASLAENNNIGSLDQLRRLQFGFDINAIANSTSCPEGCLLCQCPDQDDTDCILQQSMKACAEKSLGACYIDIFPGLDVAGLCASQCDGSKTEKELAQSGFREGCRLCEVFMCCETCPAERAGECFPSNTEEGYTPPNWEPATCASSGNNRMIGSISLMAFIIWALV